MVHLEVPQDLIEIIDVWMYVLLDLHGFENLSELAIYVLALAHDAKTNKKTKMSNSTLNAHLRVRDIMRNQSPNSWEPDEEMVKCDAKGRFHKKNAIKISKSS